MNNRRKRELKLEHENRKPLFLLTKEEAVNWWNCVPQNFTGKTLNDLKGECNND